MNTVSYDATRNIARSPHCLCNSSHSEAHSLPNTTVPASMPQHRHKRRKHMRKSRMPTRHCCMHELWLSGPMHQDRDKESEKCMESHLTFIPHARLSKFSMGWAYIMFLTSRFRNLTHTRCNTRFASMCAHAYAQKQSFATQL